MRTSGGFVGPRGFALLFVTAIAGIALAAHGWVGRQAGVAPGALGASASSASVGSGAAGGSTGSSGGSGSSSGPGASAAPSNGSPGGAPATRVGPTLSSQSFASYAFQVWPGPQSAAAKSALTGLSIAVHKTSSGISVSAGVTSQGQSPAHTYAGGARVYVVEASLGDEAGNTDYNLGDDGVVVTDAQGRILQ